MIHDLLGISAQTDQKVCEDSFQLTSMVPNEFLVLVFVLLLALGVSAGWLL